MTGIPGMTALSGDEVAALVKARDICEAHSASSDYAHGAHQFLLQFLRYSYLNEPEEP